MLTFIKRDCVNTSICVKQLNIFRARVLPVSPGLPLLVSVCQCRQQSFRHLSASLCCSAFLHCFQEQHGLKKRSGRKHASLLTELMGMLMTLPPGLQLPFHLQYNRKHTVAKTQVDVSPPVTYFECDT